MSRSVTTSTNDQGCVTADELLFELCNDTMSELTNEYGKTHPIYLSVRDQIEALHLKHHAKRSRQTPQKQTHPLVSRSA